MAKKVYYLNGASMPKAEVQENFEIIKMHYDCFGSRIYTEAFKELIFWYYFTN